MRQKNMVEVIIECGKNFVTTEEEQPLDVLIIEAKKLIDSAKDCGAKIVKFQTHTVEDEVHPNINITSPHFNHDRYSWVKRNSYPAEFWGEIKDYCVSVGLEFMATPMSRGAAELLDEIGVDRWKIGSGDVLDFVLLDYVRDTNKPVLLSSGMSTLEELKMSYQYLKEKVSDITILHCVSQYPCPRERLNLNTIPFLKKEFPEAKVGFSDHSLGIEASILASRMGVIVIEKHFTLDKNSWGPDHKMSLVPEEMKHLISALEGEEHVKKGFPVDKESFSIPKSALGEKGKYMNGADFRPSFLKGLYASRDLKKGEMYEPEMIYAMRPKSQWAVPSQNYPHFLGQFVPENIKKYDPVKI